MTITLAAASGIASADLMIFFLSLALLLGLARVLGEVARQWRQPAVLGEILAGVILGPTVFGLVPGDWYTWLFPSSGDTYIALEGFITLAAAMLLLVVGLEVDLSTVWRQGKAALLVSVCGIALPAVAGMSLGGSFPDFFAKGAEQPLWPFAIFVGIAMSITALPVIAKILMDLHLAKSDMGVLVISSAMLNDLVGWIGFAVVLALLPTPDGAAAAEAAQMSPLETIGLTLLFLALMLTIGRWLIHRSLPYVQAHLSWPGSVLVYVLFIALICAALTEQLGIHSIFGAFVAGVAIGDSRHLKQRTRDTIHQFITNIFAPVFFASIGLRLNFIDAFDIGLVALVFGVAATGKIIGSFIGAKTAGLGMRESWATGFGMASQGAVGIILGQLALNRQLIGESLMVAIVIMALGTSLLAGPLMQVVLRSKKQRRLKQFFGENQILLKSEARSSEGAIRELSRLAAATLNLEQSKVYDAVMQRERIMHTGLPGGLAVPHARLDGIKNPCVVVGRYRPGVDFDAADSRPATLVTMIITPSTQPESQIELLDLVARTFGQSDIRRELMQAETPTEFLAVLNRAESDTEQSGAGSEPASSTE